MDLSLQVDSRVPIIDLGVSQSTSGESIIEQIRFACAEVGFFYLVGHGIEESLLQDVLHHSRLFFDLETSEKSQLIDTIMSGGYTAMEEETLDPIFQKRGDTKEGFYIREDIPATDKRYNPSKFRGSQPWPSVETTPSMCDPLAFQSVMRTYFENMKCLGFRIVQLLALALDLPHNFFDECFTMDPLCALRLLHYAPVKSNPNEGIFACGAHSDYGMITLLLTDNTPGLQMYSKDKIWIDVPPIPNAFVVNLGDMLERWTNGMFRSTLHRVLTSDKSHRYSAPFFYEPSFDTVVTCLATCCSLDIPARYPPTTVGQYLIDKYMQTHADFRQHE